MLGVPMRAVTMAKQMHQRTRQQKQVRNSLCHVRQVLSQQVVDAERTGDEHEDACR
jgi:hypothetical protein